MATVQTQAAAVTLLDAISQVRTAPVAAANESKEDFKSLLDVGGKSSSQEKSTVSTKENRRDEKKDSLVAAVDSIAEKPKDVPSAAPERKTDNAERAYKNDNDRSETVRPVKNDKPENASKSAKSEKKTEGEDTSAQATQNTDNADNTQSGETGVATADDQNRPADETLALAVAVQGQTEALRNVLELLQSTGGNPTQAILKIETILSQLATYSAGDQTNTTDHIALLQGFANRAPALNPELVGKNSDTASAALAKLLTDVKNQLGTLQDVLNKLTPEQGASDVRPAFTALSGKLSALVSFLNEQPGLQAENPGLKDQLVAAARSFLTQVRNKIMNPEKSAKADVTLAVDNVTGLKADTILSTEKAQAKADTKATADIVVSAQPVTQQNTNLQVQAAATGSSVQSSSADTSGNFSSSRDNNQSLPQAVQTVRNTNQTTTAQSTSSTDFARLLQQAKTPVAEQVVFQIKTGLADGASRIHIKLDPEELGRVEIKLHVDAGGKTGVTVTADNRHTLDLLQRDSRGLERALEDAGLKTDSGSLSFNLRGEQREQNQHASSYAHSYQKAQPEEQELIPASVVTRNYVLSLTDGLDITI